jgi:alpha-tubulin suppressor-like RCC1 family protein
MAQLYQRSRPISISDIQTAARRAFRGVAATAAIAIYACAGTGEITIPPTVELSIVAIDTGSRVYELGARDTLSALTVDLDGDTVAVPVVWRSSNERVAVFERGGVFVARDTGVTTITASSLGVASVAEQFVVVWQGPAFVDTAGVFGPPPALNAGVALSDSVRVRVLNIDSIPVANARILFTITDGGGSVSPTTATTGVNGVAAAQWTLGPGVGPNTLSASVVRADGTLDTLVKDNLVTFRITAYNALGVNSGDNQTAQILSNVSPTPTVKLVDSLGAPRPGVPITFTAFSGGRVSNPVVSTDAEGVASPGTWTLGDVPGDQLLEARVSDARLVIHATATGTPIRYKPRQVVAGGFSTCGLEHDDSVKCWGDSLRIGAGDTVDVSTPTPTKVPLLAASLAGSLSHYCAVTATNEAWCWGVNALVDTSGVTTGTLQPTRMPTDITWAHLSPGGSHNCGVSLTQIAYCWGDNGSGQLGDQSVVRRRHPTPVAGGFQFTQIASGVSHTCGIATTGVALCWGSNQFGQLGDATTATRTSPTVVSGGHAFQSIAAGEVLTCGLATNASAYCWGQVGSSARTTPTDFAGAPAFTAITVGGGHACGLTSEGAAYCWGSNASGQVGDSSRTTRSAPVKVAGGLTFTQLSAGYAHTCGRTTEGAVACWGLNTSGELGEAPTTVRTVPRHVVLGVTP